MTIGPGDVERLRALGVRADGCRIGRPSIEIERDCWADGFYRMQSLYFHEYRRAEALRHIVWIQAVMLAGCGILFLSWIWRQ